MCLTSACIFPKEVRGWYQTSLLGSVWSLHHQHRGAGQPTKNPGRPGGCEGWAEDASRRPQCSVLITTPGRLFPLLPCGLLWDSYMFSFLCCISTSGAASHQLLLEWHSRKDADYPTLLYFFFFLSESKIKENCNCWWIKIWIHSYIENILYYNLININWLRFWQHLSWSVNSELILLSV